MNLAEIAFKNRNILHENEKKFKELFKLDLIKYLGGSLISLVSGFDIISFDKDIGVPDGISTRDYVDKIYGQDAVNLIQYLINIQEDLLKELIKNES